MTSKKVTRKWEIFAGRNKFLCDGRLMTAPHNGIFYVTVFLIIATSILFFVFDCPYLADRITPAIPCIGATLFIFTMGSLLRTSFSDPGIIPRAAQDEASYIEKQIEVPNSCNSPTLRPPPRTKEVLVRGQPVKLKYCYTCKIFRPPRASHCSLCDNCVDRFDHHCPWVGNCVGKRNYRFFYMFILSLAFLAVFIFSCAITHLVLLVRDPPGSAILDALRISPASAIVSAICFLSVWSVLGMAGFHTYLITTDQTTNEDIKGSFSTKRGQESPNPYSRGGVCSNCWHVLCGPMTPSLIDRRGVVTNELRMEFESRVNKQDSSPPIIVLPPYPTNEDVSAVYNTAEPTGPLSGSYTNLYRLNEMDSDQEDACECESINDKPIDLPANIPNGVGDVENKESHLYSNLAHSSYMNNNLDLDPVVLTEVGDPIGTYNRPRTSSYSNMYKLNEKNADVKSAGTIKSITMNLEPNIPNGTLNMESKEGHLYSNVGHLSYMNHNLDLDPVVLSDSKENLMSSKDVSHQRIEKMHKVPTVKFSTESSFQNVAYRREKDSTISSDELNHNTIRPLPMKIDSSDLKTNNQKQTWADRLPRNENCNIDISVLSASKLKMSHDNTMIDTALDLDSLDGSTVSLWPATV